MSAKRDAQTLRKIFQTASNLPERLLAFVHLTMDTSCTFGDLVDGLKAGGLVASHAFCFLGSVFQIQPKAGTEAENLNFWKTFLDEKQVPLSSAVSSIRGKGLAETIDDNSTRER